jgi:hypothetical protein
VLDGFLVGGALQGLLPSPLPVGHGLRPKPSLSVVLCHDFWLHRNDLGKLRRQHLGTPLMILLTGALQQ